MSATRAITLRLEPADYEQFAGEAKRLGTTPGTLARMYVRAGLTGKHAAEAEHRRRVGRAALIGLAAVRARLPDAGTIDVVQLIREGREDLDRRTAQ